MSFTKPRIALPEPTSGDPAYNQRAWPLYAYAIECAGGIAIPIPLNESQSVLASIVNSCSGILLPGSGADLDPEKYGQQPIAESHPKDAAREAADELLLQDAFNLRKPIFGICYGLQALTVWRNGTLVQHWPDRVPKDTDDRIRPFVNHQPGREVQNAHQVLVDRHSGLAQILSRAGDLNSAEDSLVLAVNSSHHQAIDRPGDQMSVVARAPEDGCIEAVEGEDPEHFILGIQWHPERSYDASSASRALFDAFLVAARNWRTRPIQESVAP